MKAERSEAPEADAMARIREIERQIRLLSTLRHQANLEAAAHYQLARIAASQSDLRAMKACREFASRHPRVEETLRVLKQGVSTTH